MDARWLAWSVLLPPTTTYTTWHLPDDLGASVRGHAGGDGDVWIGWRPGLADVPTSPGSVVLLNPRRIETASLRARGYDHVRRWWVVPSLRQARWFVPCDAPAIIAQAWNLYTPFRLRARMQKALLRSRLGQRLLTRLSDEVVMARQHMGPFEAQMCATLGGDSYSLAIATATSTVLPKATVQVISPQGTTVAYAKVSGAPNTAARIANDARFTRYIRDLDLRTVTCPRVLAAVGDDQRYMMITSALASTNMRMPLELEEWHGAALAELASLPTSLRFCDLLDALERRLEAVTPSLPSEWQSRLGRTSRLLHEHVELAPVQATLAHGDFAPWNIRLYERSSRLAIFDWEAAQDAQFPLWDALHFVTQVNLLVHRKSPRAILAAVFAGVRRWLSLVDAPATLRTLSGLYAAYLLDSCVQWFELHGSGPVALSPDREQCQRGQILDLVNDLYA